MYTYQSPMLKADFQRLENSIEKYKSETVFMIQWNFR
jgi:hypothetical protein